MPRLPVVSADELIKVLADQGFRVLRQKGSPIVLQKQLPGSTITTVVPNHRELAPGTLRSILRKTGFSPDELARLLTLALGTALHFWGIGPTTQLARGIKAALDTQAKRIPAANEMDHSGRMPGP